MPVEVKFFVLMSLIATLPFIGLWLYVLVDCIRYEPRTGHDRIVWTLVIALGSWIGALVYWLVRRPQRRLLIGR